MESIKSSSTAKLFAVIVPLFFLAVIVFPESRTAFAAATSAHPYITGFIKFAFLATTGEILAAKLTTGRFAFPNGFVLKAIIWGIIGMMITLLFPIFSAGVVYVQEKDLLLGHGNFVLTAIFTSIATNLTFGIVMMAGHRFTDTMIDAKGLSVSEVVKNIDWAGFINFVVFRTIPFFWIPAHSVTFMLPGEYRVYMSAFLSIALGLLLALAKRQGQVSKALMVR